MSRPRSVKTPTIVGSESECNHVNKAVRRRETTILRTRNDDSEAEKLLYSSKSTVYAKRHLPFKTLSIWREFFFDDTVGLRVEHESRPQECLATGEIFLPH